MIQYILKDNKSSYHVTLQSNYNIIDYIPCAVQDHWHLPVPAKESGAVTAGALWLQQRGRSVPLSLAPCSSSPAYAGRLAWECNIGICQCLHLWGIFPPSPAPLANAFQFANF